HALVVHALTGRRMVVELCGDPRRTLGAVLGVDRSDPLGERGIGPGTLLATRGSLEPGVVGGALDLDELTQSQHQRRWWSCRRRTGSDSPARLPGEILGRPLENLPLGRELGWSRPR